MKGLLLKDFYLMREKQMLPIWFILALAICTNSFIAPIMVIFTSALLPGVSLFFDKSDGWDRAMHFLPYSARAAVLSKYALGGAGNVCRQYDLRNQPTRFSAHRTAA